MDAGKNYSLTLARVTLGVILLVHGIANTFEVWGGPDVERAATDLATQLSATSGTAVTLIGVVELLLGLLLTLGSLARFAALAALALMVLHTISSARYQAFFVRDYGVEYLLALMALSVVVAMHGPGPLCIHIKLPRKREKSK